MDFVTAAHSDIGIKKKTNQDAMMIKTARTDYGKICFAAVCDGMGGLAKGELASASLIRILSRWFEEKFPEILYRGIRPKMLKKTWEQLICEANDRLGAYGRDRHVKLGTTVSVLLLAGNMYYIMHVGDSRIYKLTREIRQLTKDQTVVQREIDLGRLTPEEARRDPRRNILLQCVGASSVIIPGFYMGNIETPCSFLLCSDGFRHEITAEEILERLGPEAVSEEKRMLEQLRFMAELDKCRREEDNISAGLIYVYESGRV